ncbi:MAG: Gfo/Idh/MocA family oxidoreductase, partial [Clostridia bacterium]|nr:Gfo/Idh/MocA family oxidoreductase [Clostridia bacterium]
MSKVKIGVIGGYRGLHMIKYCVSAENAEVVAICDKADWVLDRLKERDDTKNVKLYRDYDEFLTHDMDAVVLANYAHQHAPFAIKAMKAGKHVFSEVLPCQTMKEAVELVEAVEET